MDIKLLYRDNESIAIDNQSAESQNSQPFKIEIG